MALTQCITSGVQLHTFFKEGRPKEEHLTFSVVCVVQLEFLWQMKIRGKCVAVLTVYIMAQVSQM